MGEASGEVAHDVNNLLTAIVARAALIRGQASDPAVVGHADAILKAARAAASVTDRIRTILRPRRPEEFVRVDPAAVATQAIATLAPRAEAAGVQLRHEDGPTPPVAGLAAELLQLVVNLGTNAIDAVAASQGGGAVTLRTVARDGGACVEVDDDGAGIPADLLDRLFEPFMSTKGGAGMGLGLALCRRITDLHQGRLELLPRPSGGTRAVVWLPAAGADVPEPRMTTSLELQAFSDGTRVLLVDDDEDARDGLAHLLAATGFEVRTAGALAAAFAAVEAFRPSVVVTDIALGDESGWDLVRRLRARDALLPVLVLSGDPDIHEIAAREQPASVLSKPVNPGTLVARIRQLTEQRGQLTRGPA